MARLQLDGAEIELRFDMNAYEAVQKAFGSYKAMEEARKNDETRISTNLTLARIMADSHEIFTGSDKRHDREWIAARVRLRELPGLTSAIGAAFIESWGMEAEKGEADDKPHDVVLEAIKKKTGEE